MTTIRDNPEKHRYELIEGDMVIGQIQYRREAGAVALVHTEVDPVRRGKGLASALVEWALLDLRERELRVLPVCPFVRTWLRRHPEYADLVVSDPAPPK